MPGVHYGDPTVLPAGRTTMTDYEEQLANMDMSEYIAQHRGAQAKETDVFRILR
jgi:hypothetical protein